MRVGILIFLMSSLGCSYALEEVGLFKTSDIKLPVSNVMQFSDRIIDFDVLKATSLKNCLECHSSGGNSMNTADKVLRLQDDILMVVNLGTMPPKASGLKPMSSCEQKILETWIEDKNQNRATTQRVKDIAACAGLTEPAAEKPVDLETLEVTFENLKTAVLAKKCLTCHTVETAKKTVLDNLDDIEKRDLVAGTAEESVLYQIVVPGLNKRFMPPTRSGVPPLSESEVDFLKRWIELRAKRSGL